MKSENTETAISLFSFFIFRFPPVSPASTLWPEAKATMKAKMAKRSSENEEPEDSSFSLFIFRFSLSSNPVHRLGLRAQMAKERFGAEVFAGDFAAELRRAIAPTVLVDLVVEPVAQFEELALAHVLLQ